MKKILTWIFIFVILISCIYAQDDPEEEFEQNPTPENFDQLPDPSASDLIKVINPTLSNFQKLDQGEQQQYLFVHQYNTEFAEEYLQTVDFSDTTDLFIADQYFTESVDNINSNTEIFSNYLSARGITVVFQEGASLASFSNDFWISTEKQEVNLVQGQNHYDYEVDSAGNIILIEKDSQNQHTFTGTIDYIDHNGNFDMDEGTIDGKTITQGEDIKFTEDGFTGKAKTVNVVSFKEGSSFSYDAAQNSITATDAVVLDITGDVTIGGQNIMFYDEETTGKIISGQVDFTCEGTNCKAAKISQNSKADVDGFEHSTQTTILNLYYADEPTEEMLTGNYFVYGEKEMWIGGEGFSTTVKKTNNDIFPEIYGDDYVENPDNFESMMSFNMQGGNIHAAKASSDGSALAIYTEVDGKVDINNGKWNINTDGEKMFGRAMEIDEEEGHILAATDMRFNYKTESGEIKQYDLLVQSTYRSTLTEDDIEDYKEAFKLLDRQIEDLEFEVELNEEWIKKDLTEKDLSRLDQIDVEMKELISERDRIEGQLRRAFNDGGTQEQINRFQGQVAEVMSDMGNLEAEKNKIKEKSNSFEDYEVAVKQLDSAKAKQRRIEFGLENGITAASGIGKIEIELPKEDDEEKTLVLRAGEEEGTFAQVIVSDDGDTTTSYSEYIQGFPVIKNTDVQQYYAGQYVEALGVTVGRGERLEFPEIKGTETDILELTTISSLQTCADTQLRLYADYQKELLDQGLVDSVVIPTASGGSITYRQGQDYDAFLNRAFNIHNTGSMRQTVDIIENVDDIEPGDFITGHPSSATGYGHTQGVKRVLEIPPESGNMYIELYQGYDPAQDAKVLKKLDSYAELQREINSQISVLHRFKEVEQEVEEEVAVR